MRICILSREDYRVGWGRGQTPINVGQASNVLYLICW